MDSPTRRIRLQISLVPHAQGRPRFSRQGGTAYTPEATRSASELLKLWIRQECRRKAWEPLEGPCNVRATVWLPKPKSVKRKYPTVKPDADNFAKAFLDCANGVLFRDDALVVDLHVCKRYDARAPGWDVVVEEIDDHQG